MTTDILSSDDVLKLLSHVVTDAKQLEARAREFVHSIGFVKPSQEQLAAQYVAEQQVVNAAHDRYSELYAEFAAMPDNLPLNAQIDSAYMQADLENCARFEVSSKQWFEAIEEVDL